MMTTHHSKKVTMKNKQLKQQLAKLEEPCEFKKMALLIPAIGILCGICVQFFV